MLGCCADAPVNWCCEESDISKGIMSTSSGLENVHYEGSKLHAFEKICQSIVQPKKHSKYPRAYRINGEKKVQTGKMRYLPVEEALGLSSSIKKYGSTLINTVSSRVVSIKSIATMTRAIFSKPRAKISNSFREKSKVQLPLASTGYTKPQNLRIAKNTEHSKKMFKYLKAHPLSRVRRKVYEFSGFVPDTLEFELVPHGDIWESLFNNHIPSKEDIGLYFFASEKKRFERYIALVKFMRSKDLLMRMLINDVELFILVSTALCSDSQKCDIGKGIMSSSSGLEKVQYEGSKLHPCEKICQSTVQPKKHSKFPDGHRINWEKEDEIAKFNGYLNMSFVGRKAIDVTLAAIAVGTVNCGGLAKLSIQGNWCD
ncbi:hypothetical protein MTR67_028062 [Solanum verrucosum]|uniref:AIPP2-like SPOC-like domain-containing protein n=1 Tax=Solanum verrucosum TaxID=315347 RepID=A0AAF0R1T4_SOLVR|nr:hypothetical protein MTR67_028062 [Solanum verrucosum]